VALRSATQRLTRRARNGQRDRDHSICESLSRLRISAMRPADVAGCPSLVWVFPMDGHHGQPGPGLTFGAVFLAVCGRCRSWAIVAPFGHQCAYWWLGQCATLARHVRAFFHLSYARD
jgi:hypothetical protein